MRCCCSTNAIVTAALSIFVFFSLVVAADAAAGACGVDQADVTEWNKQFQADVEALDTELAAIQPPPLDENDFTEAQKRKLIKAQDDYEKEAIVFVGDDCKTMRDTWEAANKADKDKLDAWLAIEKIPGAKFVNDTDNRCYDGSRWIHANDCENVWSAGECDTMFPVTRHLPTTKEPPVRAEACVTDGYHAEALMCAKNCFFCCETTAYKCSDPVDNQGWCQIEGASRCKSSDTLEAQLMKELCPATCGTCDTQQEHHQQPLYESANAQLLPLPSAEQWTVDGVSLCIDTGTDCSDPVILAMCRDDGMRELMFDICPKSCGFCI